MFGIHTSTMEHTYPEWNVIVHRHNGDTIGLYNILRGNLDELTAAFKKAKGDKQAFADSVRSYIRYHYWARAEWEVTVSAWCGGSAEEKVDVSDQIFANFPAFVDYLWTYFESTPRKRDVKNGGRV